MTSDPAASWRAEVGIDLAALAHNLNVLRRRAADAEIWPVIKANAYGHGAVAVATELHRLQVPRMCVVAASELAELRNAGVDTPLLVLGPLGAAGIAEAIRQGAEIAVTAPEQLQSITEAARESQLKVHLKVDTGMGRWGIPADEAVAAARMLSESPGVEVIGLMTHFATADEPDTAFVHRQAQVFDGVVESIRTLLPDVLVHASNSAATLRFPEYAHDAVRCGVALYGLDPMQEDAAEHNLHPVLSMRSVVASVRDLAPGESTGYARRFRAAQACRVALVPAGYADGIRRLLSGRGQVVVGGRPVPIVGTVSMDHISVLVDDSVSAGAPVTIIGQDGGAAIRAEDHARWAQTINYEITCGIAGEPRLARTVRNHDSHTDTDTRPEQPARARG